MSRNYLAAVSTVSITAAWLVLTAGPARAQDEAGWRVAVGAGGVHAPDFEGSDAHDTLPFPYVEVRYDDLFYIQGAEAGLNILRSDLSETARLQLGPIARYRRDRPEDRNRDLKGLGDVDTAIEVGGALRVELGRAWIAGTLAKDVAGGHEGKVATAEAGLGFDLAPGLFATTVASASWADDDYMRSYFSVDGQQASRSGLPAFDARQGLKDAGGSVALQYSLGAHWVLTGSAGYSRLLGDAADAPLVRQRGSPDQWQGALFIAYRF